MTTWTITLPNHAPDVTVVADEITTRRRVAVAAPRRQASTGPNLAGPAAKTGPPVGF
jgi:hypothetical protein